ncbi:EamA family transporter [Candidatus Saccharibacteria bacterium]|nr:EamA family transporter [Candidatus Saccharibacteria bacterium]
MNTVLVATLGGLGALFLWGVSDWLASKSSKKYDDGSYVNLTLQTSGAVIMVAILLLSNVGLPNLRQIILLILTSLFFTFAYLSYIKAFSVGEAGVVVPLANIYPLVTLLLTATFLTLSLSGMQTAAVVTIIFGAVLLGTEKLNIRKAKEHLSLEVGFALLTAALWGAGFFTVNAIVDELPWEVILGAICITMGLFSIGYYLYKHRNTKKRQSILRNESGIIAGLALTTGSIAFYVAAESTNNVVIPAVIASASPLVTSILAYIFEGERIILSKRIGALLVVLGVALLNI